MHHAVRDDRLWFERHPTAIVRFRKSADGEFDPLLRHGEQPPHFRPSFSKTSAPLGWVAVVDLMQLLGEEPDGITPNTRVRLRTPALRKASHREAAKQELMEAIAAELLEQAGDSSPSASQAEVDHDPAVDFEIPLAS